MRKLLMTCLLACSLVACTTPEPSSRVGPISSIPGAATVCTAINSDKFDLALRAYGAATDAVNLLLDLHALTQGSAKAVAIANANDRVLAAFAAAQSARKVCNAHDYAAAIAMASVGIADVQAALRR